MTRSKKNQAGVKPEETDTADVISADPVITDTGNGGRVTPGAIAAAYDSQMTIQSFHVKELSASDNNATSCEEKQQCSETDYSSDCEDKKSNKRHQALSPETTETRCECTSFYSWLR
jgi:hypothetical protein